MEILINWAQHMSRMQRADLFGNGIAHMAGNSSHLCPTLNTISLYKYLALTFRSNIISKIQIYQCLDL